jgi:hypothetical protein
MPIPLLVHYLRGGSLLLFNGFPDRSTASLSDFGFCGNGLSLEQEETEMAKIARKQMITDAFFMLMFLE